jgi:hypothetical protein
MVKVDVKNQKWQTFRDGGSTWDSVALFSAMKTSLIIPSTKCCWWVIRVGKKPWSFTLLGVGWRRLHRRHVRILALWSSPVVVHGNRHGLVTLECLSHPWWSFGHHHRALTRLRGRVCEVQMVGLIEECERVETSIWGPAMVVLIFRCVNSASVPIRIVHYKKFDLL